MNIEHKSFVLELKADAKTRRISGYASVFNNVDSTGDIVMPGAFAKSLGKRKIKMLYQHSERMLLSIWDVAREDDKGLFVEGTLAKTPLCDEVLELASIGALDSMSIGYSVKESEYNKDGVRLLKEIDLWEVSLVTFPANPLATVTGVKSIETVRQFEAFLQKHGYSDREAMLIASKGFASALSARESRGNKDDAGEPRNLDGCSKAIDNALNILKGK